MVEVVLWESEAGSALPQKGTVYRVEGFSEVDGDHTGVGDIGGSCWRRKVLFDESDGDESVGDLATLDEADLFGRNDLGKDGVDGGSHGLGDDLPGGVEEVDGSPIGEIFGVSFLGDHFDDGGEKNWVGGIHLEVSPNILETVVMDGVELCRDAVGAWSLVFRCVGGSNEELVKVDRGDVGEKG